MALWSLHEEESPAVWKLVQYVDRMNEWIIIPVLVHEPPNTRVETEFSIRFHNIKNTAPNGANYSRTPRQNVCKNY